MDTSLAHENARLRALLQTQQDTIRQMAEYNRLLSLRVAAYASEINRLKALVAKLQRMQFGKSSEKLRAKTERQIQEAQERISALQEEMAETLGEQYDPALPSALRQSSARKPLPASLPRETRVIRPEEECCPACGGELSPLGCDVSEQLELISSAFKVIETQRPKQACCRCEHIVQAPVPSKPIARSYAGAGLLAHVVTGKYADHLPLYRQSEIYRRQGVELSRATLGRWTGAVLARQSCSTPATAKIALTGAVSFGMLLRQIVSTFQHLLKAGVIITRQPHRRPGRKMHQRGMAPDIHSQGTAPRLFNHPGQRLRSAVITGTTPGIPVDQQHQVIVFFTFALPKLPGPDVMQGCGMHAFTFPMLTFLVSVDSGFQGIDEAGYHSCVRCCRYIRETQVNPQCRQAGMNIQC
ncbi:transposase IS66 family protein, partial [Escherichia coli 2-011-08_S3_C3]